MNDYHMHSHFCRHAVGRVADYARAACRKGISEICVTPHIPLPGFRPGFSGDKLRMDEKEFDAYLHELEEARAAFPQLTILSGVEADYLPDREEWLARFLSRAELDFVLMSIHFVSAWGEDEWAFDFARHRSLPSAYGDYFRQMRQGIQTGLFDCVAHLDLVKKPGRPVLATNRDDVERVLAACVSAGMSVEINTSGTRKEIGETYPCDEIITLLMERSVDIVASSDAHAPDQVGLYFNDLADRHGEKLLNRMVCYRGRRVASAGKC
ncbi:MAG TPA: histidinol-phosphatase [Spirochaetia bacterium]|nr:histidinol-phosphatase [Spirochaetia bacterium]